jgi:hypothetical protein
MVSLLPRKRVFAEATDLARQRGNCRTRKIIRLYRKNRPLQPEKAAQSSQRWRQTHHTLLKLPPVLCHAARNPDGADGEGVALNRRPSWIMSDLAVAVNIVSPPALATALKVNASPAGASKKWSTFFPESRANLAGNNLQTDPLPGVGDRGSQLIKLLFFKQIRRRKTRRCKKTKHAPECRFFARPSVLETDALGETSP